MANVERSKGSKSTKGTDSTSSVEPEKGVDQTSNASTESGSSTSVASRPPEKSDDVRDFERTVYGDESGRGSNYFTGFSERDIETDAVRAHELQAFSGSERRIEELEQLLSHRSDELREDDGLNEWNPDRVELLDIRRSPDDWRREYDDTIGRGEADTLQSIQTTLRGPDGDYLTDEQMREAVSEHRAELESEGAFDGWSEEEVRAWEKGVVEFLESQKGHAKVREFRPDPVEGLPTPEGTGEGLSIAGSGGDVVGKLDNWEDRQLQRIDDLEESIETSTVSEEYGELEDLREDVRDARAMYEEITLGEKRLPEVVPENHDGIGALDDIEAEALRENPGLHEDLVPVREPYARHLREHPGDLVGAYQVVQERTGNARFIEAGVEGAGMP